MRSLIISGFLLLASYGLLWVTEADDRLHYWYLEHLRQESAVWLPDYEVELEALAIPGISHNASGITYAPDRESFFIVVNNPPKLVELDKQLKLKRHISLVGFTDPEGVAYAGNGQLVIVDEREQSVILAPVDDDVISLEKGTLRRITLDTGGGNNKGFEGIAVNGDAIFVVREKDPMRILTITGMLTPQNNINISTHAGIESAEENLDDLSGLYYDAQSKNLLMLSDESRLIAEIDPNGETVSYMDLEAGFNGLSANIPQAEGITMDNEGKLYIISEPNLLYRYKRTL